MPAPTAPARLTDHVLEVQGRRRTFTVVDAGADAVRGGAAVLVFHGSNQTTAGLRRATGRAFDELVTAGGGVAPTVVAYLDGYRRSWHDGRATAGLAAHRAGVDDVAFTAGVVEALVAEHGTDPGRVIAVGFSNGGQMVIRLAHEAPHLLAGAVVVGAGQPVPEDWALPPAPAVPLPVLLVHGTRDPLVPYAGGPASLWGFRPRGRGMSALDTAAHFAARNGITTAPVTRDQPRRDPADPTSVTRTDFSQAGRPPVGLLTVHGGGHTVPGRHAFPRVMGRTSRQLDTHRAVAEFFGLPLG